MREPRRSGSGGGKASNDSNDAAARKLTSNMKDDIKSAGELLDLLDGVVDGPIFNHFHASAAYHSLATWKRKGGLKPSDKASPVLPRLARRVQDMSLKGELEPRQVSNVLWSLGKLSDDVDISKGLLMALVKSLGEKASGMEPQGLSNSLLACVQLKGVAPEKVLSALPILAAEISTKAEGMKPQELSNSLWAATRLKDDAPEVLTALPKLAAQISIKAKDMAPQALANSLWASAQLKDHASHEDVQKLVAALVGQIQDKAGGMNSQQLSNSLWAAAQLKDIAPDVKEIVPAIVAQIREKANSMTPQAISNSLWAVTHLKNDALAVPQMVPALVKEIPRNQADFKPQEICNCLEALVLLQDSVPEVGRFLAAPPDSNNDFVGFTASRFSSLVPSLNGKSLQFDISVVVWACARVNFYHEKLLVSIAHRLRSGRDLKTLPDWGICALLWSYDVLDPDDRFAEFKGTLESERARRGLSDSDVSESASGYFEWNLAKS